MSASGGFKINQAGMDNLKAKLEKRQFSSGIQVPLDGTEADAIQSVNDQLKKMGATPNEAEVRKIVREVRK